MADSGISADGERDDVPAARRRARGRWMTVAGLALIALGLGIALYQLWPDVSYQTGLIPVSWPYACSLPEAVASTATPDGSRVVIPAIGVDAPIVGGSPDAALAAGVYHHVETAKPGEGGTVVLAGHRDRNVFALLYALSPGDPIILYWDGAEYPYRVTRMFSVSPDDASVLENGEGEILRLYTCKPRFLGNVRTVVEATPARR